MPFRSSSTSAGSNPTESCGLFNSTLVNSFVYNAPAGIPGITRDGLNAGVVVETVSSRQTPVPALLPIHTRVILLTLPEITPDALRRTRTPCRHFYRVALLALRCSGPRALFVISRKYAPVFLSPREQEGIEHARHAAAAERYAFCAAAIRSFARARYGLTNAGPLCYMRHL